jgi:hypothetical protein
MNWNRVILWAIHCGCWCFSSSLVTFLCSLPALSLWNKQKTVPRLWSMTRVVFLVSLLLHWSCTGWGNLGDRHSIHNDTAEEQQVHIETKEEKGHRNTILNCRIARRWSNEISRWQGAKTESDLVESSMEGGGDPFILSRFIGCNLEVN